MQEFHSAILTLENNFCTIMELHSIICKVVNSAQAEEVIVFMEVEFLLFSKIFQALN